MKHVKKIDRAIEVIRADNGYIVEYGYRDQEDDWKRSKTVTTDLEAVIAFLKLAEGFPLDD